MKKSNTAPVKLSEKLKKAADGLPVDAQAKESIERRKLIGAIARKRQSRFDLAEVVIEYRDVYKNNGNWLKAAKAIATELEMGTRSLFRLINTFEAVRQLPSSVRAAMKEAGFDPMRLKNYSVVEAVLAKLPTDSDFSVDAAGQLLRLVRTEMATFVDPRSSRSPLSHDQKLLWSLRTALRRSLKKVPAGEVRDYLRRAIEQEMFEVFGESTPFKLHIVPQEGPLTLGGLLRDGAQGCDQVHADGPSTTSLNELIVEPDGARDESPALETPSSNMPVPDLELEAA